MMSTAETPVESPKPPLPMQRVSHCWICGGSDLKVIWKDLANYQWTPRIAPYDHAEHPPIEMARCAGCGFAQPAWVPDLDDFYDRIYYREWTEEDLEKDFTADYRDVIFADVLRGLASRLPAGNRKLIDIGTHTGRFPWLASQSGWQAEAIEINPVTASFAARRTGLPIHTMKAEELAATGRRYHAATLNDVLEHLPEPLGIIRGVAQILEPGGVLSIKVPHGPMQLLKERIRRDMLGLDPMMQRAGVMQNFVHVNQFSVNSMKTCLESAGLRVLTIRPARPEHVAVGRHGLVRTTLVKSFDLAARFVPGAVHTPLAMNLQAFAVKPS
jgi:SAM-dependent methyltransferase